MDITQSTNRRLSFYITPIGEDEIGGLNRFDIYYVEKVDNNTIKLKDTSNNVINLTGYGTSVNERHQLCIAYEISNVRRSASSYTIYWETYADDNSGVGSGRDLTILNWNLWYFWKHSSSTLNVLHKRFKHMGHQQRGKVLVGRGL